MIAGATMVAVAEGLALGEGFGLDPAKMVEVLNVSTGRSFVTELVAREHVIPARFATGFALGLLAKDVRIAADLGEDVQLDLPMFRLTRERFAMARDMEGPASDSSRAFVAVGASDGDSRASAGGMHACATSNAPSRAHRPARVRNGAPPAIGTWFRCAAGSRVMGSPDRQMAAPFTTRVQKLSMLHRRFRVV
jgi:hypothetical protein